MKLTLVPLLILLPFNTFAAEVYKGISAVYENYDSGMYASYSLDEVSEPKSRLIGHKECTVKVGYASGSSLIKSAKITAPVRKIVRPRNSSLKTDFSSRSKSINFKPQNKGSYSAIGSINSGEINHLLQEVPFSRTVKTTNFRLSYSSGALESVTLFTSYRKKAGDITYSNCSNLTRIK